MKVAIITGANRGLGFETTKQLAKNGFKVYMCSRDAKKGEIAALSLRDKGMNIESVALDVTKTSDIRNLAKKLDENNEVPDLIINNAGVFLESAGPEDNSTSSVFKVDPVIILKTIEANTIGPLKLLQSLLPKMIQRGSGQVINISSGMGALNSMTGHWPGYRMSKTSLNALTKIFDAELEGTSITVNSVCPGWVKTDMGGKTASKGIEEGVDTIVWLALLDSPPRGKFFQDRKEIPW